MLSFLARQSRNVTAMDIDLVPLERVKKYIPLAENIQVLDANEVSLSQLKPKSFDLINALDVLEHVDDLPHTLSALLALLKPGIDRGRVSLRRVMTSAGTALAVIVPLSVFMPTSRTADAVESEP